MSFHTYLLLTRYIAKVIEIEEGDQEVLVHFEKWNSRYDEYIKVSSGRLRSLHRSRLEVLEKEQENSRKVGDLSRVLLHAVRVCVI